ncbi:hypothetical protein WME88_30155 [Sorangium sp. So ce216]
MKTVPVVSMMLAAVLGSGCVSESAEEWETEEVQEDAMAAVNLNVNVDVLGIANAIASSVNVTGNREGFVKNLMESTYYAAGQKYNVMVFNLSQGYEDRFNGVQFYGSAVFQGITFGIWAFEGGEFTNKGDGGWINWAFRGVFDRNGNHVVFKKF